MPLDPPVTMATLPFNAPIGASGFLLHGRKA
jgi:hypothetical protein